MASSRGNNPALTLKVTSCNSNQGFTCVVVGAACNTCSVPGFTDTKGGAGGWNPGALNAGNCGTIFRSICPANLVCPATTNTNVACNKPVGPPTNQTL